MSKADAQEVPSAHEAELPYSAVTEHWDSVPREGVEPPSLEMFQTQLDTVLCHVLQDEQGGRTIDLRAPFLTQSVMCELRTAQRCVHVPENKSRTSKQQDKSLVLLTSLSSYLLTLLLSDQIYLA